MSYAMLLEEYKAEQEAANVTFASIAENIDAIRNFVAEDVTLDFSIELESASDVEAIKEAAEESKKNFFVKIGNKLKEVFEKLVARAKEIFQKAVIAAANGGNNLMKKLIKDKAVTKSAVTLKELENLSFGDILIVESKMSTLMNKVAAKGATSAATEHDDEDKRLVDNVFRDSKIQTKPSKSYPAGTSVATLHKDYVEGFITKINYKKFNEDIKKAANDAKTMANAYTSGGDLEKLNKDVAVSFMKLGTSYVELNFQLVTIGVANAAKIAGACIKKDKAEKAEEKKEEKKEEK